VTVRRKVAFSARDFALTGNAWIVIERDLKLPGPSWRILSAHATEPEARDALREMERSEAA